MGDGDGVDGLASIDFFGLQDLAADLVIDEATGNIVVVGRVAAPGTIGAGVARLTPAGLLDVSFGTGGKTYTSISVLAEPRSVAFDGNDNIVVGGLYQSTGSATSMDFMAMRYTSSGVLDTSFDGDGIATTNFSGDRDEAYDMLVQSDNKIVVLGSAKIGSFTQLAMVRYNMDGSLDTTFDGDGKVLTDIDPTFSNDNDLIDQGVLLADGRIVVAGQTTGSGGGNMVVARYNPNGSLDTTTFNSAGAQPGTIQLNFGFSDLAEGIALQPDGAYAVVGASRNIGVNEIVRAMRVKADGTLDTAFGTGGSTTVDLVGGTAIERSRDVAITPDGKIIAGGVVANTDFLLAQFDAGLLVADAGGPYAIDEPGGSVVLNGTNFGGEGPVLYEWDLDGDNIFGEVGVDATYGDEVGTNPTFTVTGVDGPDDSFTVTLQLTDDNQTITDTATINIANVAPTLTISGAASVDEGSAYTLSLSSSDPGNDTITQWTINWGDTVEVVAGNPANVDSHLCRWRRQLHDQRYSHRRRRHVCRGGNTVAVMVLNVDPTLAISGASSVDEGSAYTLNLSSSDPGDDTITQWTINWGDAVEVVSRQSGQRRSHTYTDGDASYTISATATDEDGTFAAATTVRGRRA